MPGVLPSGAQRAVRLPSRTAPAPSRMLGSRSASASVAARGSRPGPRVSARPSRKPTGRAGGPESTQPSAYGACSRHAVRSPALPGAPPRPQLQLQLPHQRGAHHQVVPAARRGLPARWYPTAAEGPPRLLEAAGIEPAPGGAKLPAESRPYPVTARNAWESVSRRVPSCPALFRPIPHAPATYVQHGRRPNRVAGAPQASGLAPCRQCREEASEVPPPHLQVWASTQNSSPAPSRPKEDFALALFLKTNHALSEDRTPLGGTV